VPAEHMKLKREHLVPFCNRASDIVADVSGEKFLSPTPTALSAAYQTAKARSAQPKTNKQKNARRLSAISSPVKPAKGAVACDVHRAWASLGAGWDGQECFCCETIIRWNAIPQNRGN